MSDQVKVKTSSVNGGLILGEGYLKRYSEEAGICTFHADVRASSTGRAFPISYGSSVYFPLGKILKRYPSIFLENGKEAVDECQATEFYFPEFEGWRVFSVTGGKIFSICLVRNDYEES